MKKQIAKKTGSGSAEWQSRLQAGDNSEKKGVSKRKTDRHAELFEKVRELLDAEVRPYLNSHGGDIEIVAFDKEKRLHVRLNGACHGCPAAGATLRYFVQDALDEEFREDEIEVVQVME